MNSAAGHGKNALIHSSREKDSNFTCAVFKVPAAAADDAAGILIAYGALGCEVKKLPATRGPGRAKKAVLLHAYFRRLTSAALRRIVAILQGMILPGWQPTLHQITDPGWAKLWQTRFEPLPIGRRFLIVPPWRRAKNRDRHVIVLRPGRAFGTGHHPSTFGTLNLIEEWCENHRVVRALDVGTGSGILAIAMRKLRVNQIVALEIDATALENARENAELNGIDTRIRFSMAPLGSIRGRFDLITANILSSVLIEMAPALKTRLRPGGGLILAGILKREADRVISAFAPELRCVQTRIDKAWAALLMARL